MNKLHKETFRLKWKDLQQYPKYKLPRHKSDENIKISREKTQQQKALNLANN